MTGIQNSVIVPFNIQMCMLNFKTRPSLLSIILTEVSRNKQTNKQNNNNNKNNNISTGSRGHVCVLWLLDLDPHCFSKSVVLSTSFKLTAKNKKTKQNKTRQDKTNQTKTKQHNSLAIFEAQGLCFTERSSLYSLYQLIWPWELVPCKA